MPHVAHRKNGGYVLVPDHVAENQKHWDETRKRFTGRPCDSAGVLIPGARAVACVLRGDLYGLHTTGTGDMVVVQHRYEKKEKA